MIHMENKDLHVAIVLSPICGPIPSRGQWWLPGNFLMAQSCAAWSMRITGFLVTQCIVSVQGERVGETVFWGRRWDEGLH